MTYYIFLYCTIHDDGFVIKSENYNVTCKCEGSEFCDFIYNGMVSYDGTTIKEIDPILRNYFDEESEIDGWLDLNSH